MATSSLRTGRAGAQRLTWAAHGLAIADLGLDSAAPLFAPSAAAIPRLEELGRDGARSRWSFPLPGSPDARGNLTGRPRALGTGRVWLSVFRGSLRELLRARLSAPRSASLAEREWNLLCALRAHGVGTPEPLLVGALGSGLASRDSFLVVRAPEDAFPLPRWLRTDGVGAERERGLEALGRALARLARSPVELPALAAEHVWIAPSGSGECETHEGAGPRKNKLPGVAIVDVAGGRMRARANDPVALVARVAEGWSAEERARLERLARGG